MKLKNNGLQELQTKITRCAGIKNLFIANKIIANNKIVNDKIKELTDAIHPPDVEDENLKMEISQFEKAMGEGYPKYCQTNPRTGGQELADPKGWQMALDAWKEKWPSAGKWFTENEGRIKNIMDEDIEVNLKTIGKANLPSDTSADEIYRLSFMIDNVVG